MADDYQDRLEKSQENVKDADAALVQAQQGKMASDLQLAHAEGQVKAFTTFCPQLGGELSDSEDKNSQDEESRRSDPEQSKSKT